MGTYVRVMEPNRPVVLLVSPRPVPGRRVRGSARSSRAARDYARRDLPQEHRRGRGRGTAGSSRRRVSVLAVKGSRALVVQSYAKHWHEVFPQAAPGRKHNRRIVLADWQRDVVDAHPEQFLRGLIHSDGCRVINRFKTKLPSGRVAEYEVSALLLQQSVG